MKHFRSSTSELTELRTALMQSRVSTGIYMVLEMRDGDKNKLLDNGILKVVINITDIISQKLLGMNAGEQADIDKLMTETLDGTKKEWSSFKANLGANPTLAISMTVRRAGAAVKLANKRTDKFVMPVLSFNVINDGSRGTNRLAYQEIMTAPTGGAMITVTEVYHTLNFGHQDDVRRDACNVGDKTGLDPSAQHINEALYFITGVLGMDQFLATLRMKCRLMKRGVSLVRHDSQGCPTQLCAETCRNGKCSTP